MSNKLSWSKVLSKTDAQQETKGAKMPFLRLTKEDMGINHNDWFKEIFFKSIFEGKEENKAKRYDILINVTIENKDIGNKKMTLDYNLGRADNHAAPAFHLHYDHTTRQMLEQHDLSGHEVELVVDDGQYFLTIK